MIPGLNSLLLKIIVNVFFTSIIMLLLYGGLVFSQISSLTDEMAKENLLEQARKIASFLEYDRNGDLTMDFPKRDRDYFANEAGEHQYAVMNTKWEYLFSSDNFMKDEIRETLEQGGEYYFEFTTEEGDNFIALKYDYLFDEKIYPVYIVENEALFREFLETMQSKFNINILIYGLPLLFLQGILIILLFRNALSPIIQVAKDARNIKYDNLSFRLNDKNVPVEVMPLIKSVNNGLARLENSANAEKLFIANAAHELRTPISILKARIASLQNEKEIYTLNQDLRHINRLISQMLDISRLDVSQVPDMGEVNLNDVAHAACEDMGALFVGQDKPLSLDEKSKNQIVTGNEEMIFRAILNLLENALKYTPADSSVKVMVENKSIIIRDFGQPIAAEYQDKIFERFEKSPENLSSKGSGLGLAIVKKTAEIHGARIQLITRENGNDFILAFPTD